MYRLWSIVVWLGGCIECDGEMFCGGVEYRCKSMYH